MSVPSEEMMGLMIDNDDGDDECEYCDTENNQLNRYLDQGNIVDEIDDNTKVTSDILELYSAAKRSMEPWLKKYKRSINLAKLQAMSGDTEISEKSFLKAMQGSFKRVSNFMKLSSLPVISRKPVDLEYSHPCFPL